MQEMIEVKKSDSLSTQENIQELKDSSQKSFKLEIFQVRNLSSQKTFESENFQSRELSIFQYFPGVHSQRGTYGLWWGGQVSLGRQGCKTYQFCQVGVQSLFYLNFFRAKKIKIKKALHTNLTELISFAPLSS